MTESFADYFNLEISMVLRLMTRALVLASVFFLLSPIASAQRQHSSERQIEVQVGADDWFRGTYQGTVPAEDLAPGCVGHVPDEPNFVLLLEGDRWVRLTVEPRDDADTTLLIRSHSGSICNNDASRYTQNPEIVTHLEAGRYRIFVGTVDADTEGRFDFHIEDLVNSDLPEISGDDRVNLLGVSGGAWDASELGGGCVGSIPTSPNHTVLVPESGFLAINVQSSSDLTLVVVAEDGVRCNDDGFKTLDPQVADWFPEGPLRIYVGSHNDSVTAYYSLTIESREPGSASR